MNELNIDLQIYGKICYKDQAYALPISLINFL